MKTTLFRWAIGAAAAVAAVIMSSCAYDPYYTSESSYGGGYGDGYGYGGSGFSTSVFVSTGDPRWGYDPYCHSYYDYNRRAYYDPFLFAYYPIGYRPAFVYGVPHPYGWRAGYCPPPSRVRYTQLSNYRNRESLYRQNNFSWAGQVRQRDGGGPGRNFNGPGGAGRDFRPNNGGFQPRDGQSREGNRYPRSAASDVRADFNRESSRFNANTRPGGDSTRNFQRPDFNRSGNSGVRDRSQFQGQGAPSSPQFRSEGGRRPYTGAGYNSPIATPPQRNPQFTPSQRAESPRESRPAPAVRENVRSSNPPQDAGRESRGSFQGRGRDFR